MKMLARLFSGGGNRLGLAVAVLWRLVLAVDAYMEYREEMTLAKVIMVQGTMSNAGKSFLAAGLCRIFKQDGYSAAPFKSQNMALNSYITDDGFEMGRAQVMQAEAAGIAPEVAMNPILLKPTSHMGSQLIVNGEVRGNYPASEYYKLKKSLIPDVMQAYESLAERFDIIVVEGAGSPAEINLRENDIVNMGLAELIDAPVLLAGDIDRGGVFAQLYGTVALVSEAERARIKALIINKFRGDKEILKPGLSMLYDKCRIPIAGVVPYMDVDVDDEDSLAERLTVKKLAVDREGREAFARIAVLKLPRISNFTDFNVLERLPGISLSYVTRPEDIRGADMVLIPGTKNTMGDLKWLRQTGLEAAVLKAVSEGVLVFGICGGFQMLGRGLSDPHGAEEGGYMRGMGLLPVETVFAKAKTRTRVHGRTTAFEGWFHSYGTGKNGEGNYFSSGPKNADCGDGFTGYEIHMGETRRMEGVPFSVLAEENGAGAEKEDGCVYGNVGGSYVHGLFDSEEIQKAVWKFLASVKGVPENRMNNSGIETFSVFSYKERQYNKMADILRENLDMDMVYQILNRER